MPATYQFPKDLNTDTVTDAYSGKYDFSDIVDKSDINTDLSNFVRLAGSLGQLFGGSSIEGSTEELKKETREVTKKIKQSFANIYPALTGLTGEEALNQYYDNFAKTVSDVNARTRADLGISPDISTEYNRLNTRIQDIQNQYSLGNRLGGFETIAAQGAAPGQVTKVDVASIRDVADWVDPATNQIKAKYKGLYDYGDPQTQQFIYGSRNTADAIGKYYNTSGDVAGLMNYGGLA